MRARGSRTARTPRTRAATRAVLTTPSTPVRKVTGLESRLLAIGSTVMMEPRSNTSISFRMKEMRKEGMGKGILKGMKERKVERGLEEGTGMLTVIS